jgi:protoporphyrinogen oxidase
MMRKVLTAVPGLRPANSGRFFYPRNGFGQISDAYAQAAYNAGAEIWLNAPVRSVEIGGGGYHIVNCERDGQPVSVEADYVWSTIPITALARSLQPAPPEEFLRAAERIDYRAMILIYLVLEQEQFSEYDAHYFPEPEIPISRLSEPKNYRNGYGPEKLTVLCAELPCAPVDPEWEQSDAELGQLVSRSLDMAGIPVQARVKQVVTRRLRQAYPIYRQGYEDYFDQLDAWLGQIDRLLSFGRQGLFAHDNTHHTLYMAYAAVNCLSTDGQFDHERWKEYRRVFETHVVED